MFKKPLSKNDYLIQLENSPKFQRSRQFEELVHSQIDEAQYLAKPDIVLGADYREERVAPVNHFLHASVAVVIPIIDRSRHSVEMARANARTEEAQKRLVMYELMSSLNQNYQKLVSSYRSMEIFKIGKIKQQEQRFKLADKSDRRYLPLRGFEYQFQGK